MYSLASLLATEGAGGFLGWTPAGGILRKLLENVEYCRGASRCVAD